MLVIDRQATGARVAEDPVARCPRVVTARPDRKLARREPRRVGPGARLRAAVQNRAWSAIAGRALRHPKLNLEQLGLGGY